MPIHDSVTQLIYNYLEDGGVSIKSHEACNAHLVYDEAPEKLAERVRNAVVEQEVRKAKVKDAWLPVLWYSLVLSLVCGLGGISLSTAITGVALYNGATILTGGVLAACLSVWGYLWVRAAVEKEKWVVYKKGYDAGCWDQMGRDLGVTRGQLL